MIPKTIHYCWFGGKEKPNLAKKCIKSWQTVCPHYRIREWNEDNVSLESCPEYVRQAYEAKKYAYVTDYVRLKVLLEHGGFYMDTDVQALKPLDILCQDRAVIGFENDQFVNSGQMLAAEAGHPVLAEMMAHYNQIQFYHADGTMNLVGCPRINTQVLTAHGLQLTGLEQTVAGVHVYPADWFNPLDSATGLLNKTENTMSIHWYSMSWISPVKRFRVKVMRRIRRVFKMR